MMQVRAEGIIPAILFPPLSLYVYYYKFFHNLERNVSLLIVFIISHFIKYSASASDAVLILQKLDFLCLVYLWA